MALYDGFGGVSTTTGTGYMDITGDIAGYSSLQALADGSVIEGSWQTPTSFEMGRYTKTGGASPRLTRSTVLSQIDRTSNPVNWGAGEKVFTSGVSAFSLPALNANNAWTGHQYLRGKKVAFDTSDTTWLDSDADGELRLVVASAEMLRAGRSGGVPYLKQQFVDAGAGAGPIYILYRKSSSPAIDDALAQLLLTGNNDAGIEKIYASIYSQIKSPVSGAEAGRLLLNAIYAGAGVTAMEVRGDTILAFPGVNDSGRGLLVGKTGQSGATVGIELISSGLGAFTSNNNICLLLNRLNGNGTLIAFQVNNSAIGTLGNTGGGVLALGGAVMAHPSEWSAAGYGGPGFESLGWVVCTEEGVIDDPSGRHPLVSLSSRVADPCVYGVIGGREPIDADGKPEGFGGLLSIEAVGSGMVRCVGPVRRGDLLMTSDVRGCAQAQPDDVIRSYTLAKATQSSTDLGGARLVPCTLLAG